MAGRAVPKYGRPGRPRQDAQPVEQTWQVQVQAPVRLEAEVLDREAQRKASFLVATNGLDAGALPDLDLIQTYKAQSTVERRFAFLKGPLFLASSVFLKKPQRIMALAFIMALCLLVYRPAEGRHRRWCPTSCVGRPVGPPCTGSSSASKGSTCST